MLTVLETLSWFRSNLLLTQPPSQELTLDRALDARAKQMSTAETTPFTRSPGSGRDLP